MSNKNLTKDELAMTEFDEDGHLVWVHPADASRPFVPPRPVQQMLPPHYVMDLDEEERSRINREKAARRRDAAVKRWKEEHDFRE